MSSVVVLRRNLPSTAWKCAFADSLIGLCPEMNPDAADELADTAVRQAREQDPVTAARQWASRSRAAPVQQASKSA